MVIWEGWEMEMIDLMDFNQYRQARMTGDADTLDALKKDDPHMYSIYERVFDYEKLQGYIRELDR